MAGNLVYSPIMAEQAASGGVNKLIQQLMRIWPLVAPLIKGVGLRFAQSVAAYYLIPDEAVMTKEEIKNGTELSQSELLLRKSAVPVIISTLAGAPSKVVNIGRLVQAPGVESKVRAFAAVLKNAPGFYLTYQALAKRIEEKTPTLNIRELSAGKKGGAAFTGMFALGTAIDKGIPVWNETLARLDKEAEQKYGQV